MNPKPPRGWRRRDALGALAGASALLAAGTAPAREGAPLPAVGSAFALADLPLIDGSAFKAADARGQVVVLYWWASWCPFCALQSPHVQKLWAAQRARGLYVLGVSIDRRADDARQYQQQRGYNFPSAWQAGAVLPKPGKSLPVTVVLGRDGRVVMAEDGQLFPEDVEQIARFL
jgi:peroxiredoxin